MNPNRRTTMLRLGAFALVAVLVLGLAWAAGRGTRSTPRHRAMRPAMSHHHAHHGHAAPAAGGGSHDGMQMNGGSMAGMSHDTSMLGLGATAGGYTLTLGARPAHVGANPLTFQVVDAHGAPLLNYDMEFNKLLHLIVVRSDLAPATYQHVHPVLAHDGTWSIALRLPTPGKYRLVTDFTPEGGERTVLATTVAIAGTPPHAVALQAPSNHVLIDGYDVAVDTSALAAGAEGFLKLAITRGGKPAHLEPVLGTFGHAVLMRAPDLAYLHVHPDSGDVNAGTISFAAVLPAPARYAAFVQFRAGGRDHIAAFTVDARHAGGHGGG